MVNPETQELKLIHVNGHEIAYDLHGTADGPVVMLVSGWCQDHRLFKYVVDDLAKHHRVLRVNWRGHMQPGKEIEDFGVNEMADDLIAVLDALGIDQVIPVSTSHGGWANIELCERLGAARIPRSIVIDWILVEAGEGFIQDLRKSQEPDTWVAARQSLFDHWLGVSHNEAIRNHLENEMGSFGYDMWARSCRVIEGAYAKWGSPMKRMAALTEKRPIIHVYSQAPLAGYEEIQDQFIAEQPWFAYRHISGETHFPTLESPEATTKAIHDFVSVD